MVTITIKGREIPLTYTVWEMKTIQEEIGPMSKAINLVTGRNPDDPEDTERYGSAEHLEAAAKLIRILGNAGLEESGQEPYLTDKYIMRALIPADFMGAVSACMDAMNEGMTSEIPEKKKKGPVDVTLEEINKKKGKES